MKRRILLSTAPLLIGISGCIEGSEENAQTDRDNEVWPAGANLVSIYVNEGFSSKLILEADCRDGKFSIEPGESLSIDREIDGESCRFQLLHDDEVIYDGHVSGATSYSLSVEEDGEIISDPAEI